MEYNISILDEVKFGDQIKDNKLSFLKDGNPIVIKALNGSEYWVTINEENNLNYISTDFVDLSKLKEIGLNEEDIDDLKKGQTIELYVKNEKYHINVDLLQNDNIKVSKDISFYDLEKMYSEPELFKHNNYDKIESEKELFKILDSYEKLPFGEFSYNDVDKVIKETKESGYIIEFKLEDGADIKSVKKQVPLDEIKIKQSIINFVGNNSTNTRTQYFIDKKDLNVYTVDGIRADGKIYFSLHNNSEKTFNYYEGKPFNVDNIIKGNFSDLFFFDNHGNSKKIEEIFHITNNNQISNTMAKEELSAKDIDVKGAKTAEDKPVITYKEGDPVLVKEGDLTLVGIIKDAKDGNLTIDVRNNKEIKETKANEKDVEPLFYVNKEDQKIWLKFSYKEISRALNNTNGIKVKLENNQVMGLMAGEKSKVMPYQVEIDGKLANVEGRVFLRRNAEGNPYVAHDVKHNELNLDLPVYGVKLNDEQKQTLIQKGELGLVSGFKSGDKDFSLWVGLDKELNKVVTKRENDVYIDKVYGVQLSEMQKNELKKGNGVEIKDKNLFIKVSAAGTSSNSLGVYKTEKAIELGLMKKVEEKKNGRGTGMKM